MAASSLSFVLLNPMIDIIETTQVATLTWLAELPKRSRSRAYARA